MVKAILFDCFGVLVGNGFDYTYRYAGGDPVIDHAFIEDLLIKSNLGQISDAEFHASMSTKLGLSQQQWMETLKQAEALNIPLLTFITQLRKYYKTAIVSNANRGVLEQKIGTKWLADSFDSVIISAEVGVAKPDPEIYKIACTRIDIAPQDCVYVDDRQSFIDVAENLGMSGVLYTNYESCIRQLEQLAG